MTEPKNHISALTSLRFFAAFYVLICHSGGPALISTGVLPAAVSNFLSNGFLGVTFFFVLSGFILTHVYYGKLGTTEAAARYGVARFARVYPVYLLSLMLMAPFAPSTSVAHMLPQFVLLQSWIPLSVADGGLVANWNGQAWTLSVELFFYLLLPLLLPLIERQKTGPLLVAAAVICTVMVLLHTPAISEDRNLPFDGLRYVPLPILRAPEFIYGVLLGALSHKRAVPPKPLLLRGLLLATLAALCASRSPWVASGVTVLLGFVIVLVPAGLGAGLLSRLLTSKVLVLLGGASYGLYILQTPVHSLMKWLFAGKLDLVGRVLYVPMLVGVSVLVFLLFEEKVRGRIRWAISPRLNPIPR